MLLDEPLKAVWGIDMKQKEMFKFYIRRVYRHLGTFLKWCVFAAIVGLVVGGFSTLFVYMGFFNIKMIRGQIWYYLPSMQRRSCRSVWHR